MAETTVSSDDAITTDLKAASDMGVFFYIPEPPESQRMLTDELTAKLEAAEKDLQVSGVHLEQASQRVDALTRRVHGLIGERESAIQRLSPVIDYVNQIECRQQWLVRYKNSMIEKIEEIIDTAADEDAILDTERVMVDWSAFVGYLEELTDALHDVQKDHNNDEDGDNEPLQLVRSTARLFTENDKLEIELQLAKRNEECCRYIHERNEATVNMLSAHLSQHLLGIHNHNVIPHVASVESTGEDGADPDPPRLKRQESTESVSSLISSSPHPRRAIQPKEKITVTECVHLDISMTREQLEMNTRCVKRRFPWMEFPRSNDHRLTLFDSMLHLAKSAMDCACCGQPIYGVWAHFNMYCHDRRHGEHQCIAHRYCVRCASVIRVADRRKQVAAAANPFICAFSGNGCRVSCSLCVNSPKRARAMQLKQNGGH
jgi:hypothetical protein